MKLQFAIVILFVVIATLYLAITKNNHNCRYKVTLC